MSKIALIFGISGQDGAYLSKLLLEKGVKKETESKINEIFSEANKILNDLNLDTSFLHSYSMHILNRRR